MFRKIMSPLCVWDWAIERGEKGVCEKANYSYQNWVKTIQTNGVTHPFPLSPTHIADAAEGNVMFST